LPSVYIRALLQPIADAYVVSVASIHGCHHVSAQLSPTYCCTWQLLLHIFVG